MSAIIPAVPRLRRKHPVANGLVAYYPFYEGSGGSLNDIAGSQITGTLTNMDPATDWVAGPNGWALDFDATNDLVNCGTNPALSNLGPLTFSAWIYSAGVGESNVGIIIGKRNFGLEFAQVFSNQLQFYRDFTTTDLTHRTSAGSLPVNQWVHVALSWDGSLPAANARIYINGAEPGYAIATDAVGTAVSDAADALTIGNNAATSRTFNGRIANVSIWNRAFAVDEIALLYSQPDLLIEPPSTRKIFLFKSAGSQTLTPDAAEFEWVVNDATISTGAATLTPDAAEYQWTANDATVAPGPAPVAAAVAPYAWVANDATISAGAATVDAGAAEWEWTVNDAAIPVAQTLDAVVVEWEWIANDATASAEEPPNPNARKICPRVLIGQPVRNHPGQTTRATIQPRVFRG